MPEHIIIESYGHYKARKNLKWWVLITIILLGVILISSYKDFGISPNIKKEAETREDKIETSKFTKEYRNCLNACKNIFSEGEEMTKACDIIRDDEKSGLGNMHLSRCSYLGIAFICECMKEKSEEECKQESVKYLKEINCAR